MLVQRFRSGSTVPFGQMVVKDIWSSSVSPRTSSSISERSSCKTAHRFLSVEMQLSAHHRADPQVTLKHRNIWGFSGNYTFTPQRPAKPYIYSFGMSHVPGVLGDTTAPEERVTAHLSLLTVWLTNDPRGRLKSVYCCDSKRSLIILYLCC